MTDSLYISTVRGAGLGFAAAAAFFTVTDRVISFWLIPVGLALGLGIGIVARRSAGGNTRSSQVSWTYDDASFLSRFLLHPKLQVRFLTLFTVSAALFVLAWYSGYHLLPEGALAGHAGSPAAVHERAPSVVVDWLKMATWNLVPMAVAVIANAFMRVRGIPMGYLAILIPTTSYGLTLGTNSFTFPMPERLPPSLAVLNRAGPYEFAAMILVITATYAISRFEINSLSQTEFQRNPDARRLTAGEWIAIGLGVALLFAAAWREAVMIAAL